MTISRLRVLIVDDFADDAFVFGKLLERLGCEVQTCNDPTRCMELAESFQPHLIFVDYAMPCQSGPATARLLRSARLPAGHRLVARTGYATERVKQECLDAGFSHVLIKPIDLDRLRALLDEVRSLALLSPHRLVGPGRQTNEIH